MDLRHLRCFVAVAEELHFGRAAQRLGIAQPPLSQQIRRLERDLGVRLFARSSRRVELTDAGRLLLPEARAVLERAGRARELMHGLATGESGRISVGFVGSAALSRLPDIVLDFRTRYPGVSLNLTEMTSGQQLDALNSRSIQLGCVRVAAIPAPLASRLLARERLVLAMPLALGESAPAPLPLSSVAGADFIMSPREMGESFHDSVMDACARAGFVPRVVQEAIQMQTIVALVAAGIGVALVPESIQTMRRPGVAYRGLTDIDAYSDLSLAWRPDDVDPVTRNLLHVAGAHSVEYGDDYPISSV